jgi:hypothetical protein
MEAIAFKPGELWRCEKRRRVRNYADAASQIMGALPQERGALVFE